MPSKPRILVVDDYPDGREMLAEYLTYHEFPIREARDGQEAIDLAVSWKPSVILMDLQMPGMDGWDTKDILVVALTAHALRREVQAARSAGCDAVVPKPYAISLLADALMRALEIGPAAFDVPGLGVSGPVADDPRSRQV
jgi:two-component system sensor histidine kinase/response regulator